MNLRSLGRQTFAAPLAALTLVAGGGIALAASGGDPAPQAVEHRAAAAQTVEHGPDAKPSATGKPTVKPAEDRAEDRSDESASDASPSPSLTGLCRAYQAGGYASSTKNGHVNPAWSALESAAGGEDDVDEYCDDRLAADSDDIDEPKAGNPGRGPKPANARGGDRGESGSHASEHDNH